MDSKSFGIHWSFGGSRYRSPEFIAGLGNPVVLNRQNSSPIMGLVVNLALFGRFLAGQVGDRQTADYSGKTRMLN